MQKDEICSRPVKKSCIYLQYKDSQAAENHLYTVQGGPAWLQVLSIRGRICSYHYASWEPAVLAKWPEELAGHSFQVAVCPPWRTGLVLGAPSPT